MTRHRCERSSPYTAVLSDNIALGHMLVANRGRFDAKKVRKYGGMLKSYR